MSLNLKYKILFISAVPFASRLRSMLIAALSHCRLFENFMQEFQLSGWTTNRNIFYSGAHAFYGKCTAPGVQ